jgi:hypothetical protein
MPVGAEIIGPDTPLRLEDADRRAFPVGGITVSGLRKEAARGRLEIEVIAGKQFTTLRAIERMRGLCRVKKEQGSGSNLQPTRQTECAVPPIGSSETDRAKSALAALKTNAKKNETKLAEHVAGKYTIPTERRAIAESW